MRNNNVFNRVYSSKTVHFLVMCSLGFLLVLSIGNIFKTLTYQDYPDFSTYYQSAKLYSAGENPYSESRSLPSGAFIYPPVTLLFFLPFVSLSPAIAGKVFTGISLLSYFTASIVLYRCLQIRLLSIVGMCISILLLQFFPVKFTLGMGQLNNILFLLVALFIYLQQKNKIYLSGLSLALAISFKLFPILVIPLLLIERKWKLGISTIIGIGLIMFITFLLIDHSAILYFLHVTTKELATTWSAVYYNQSLTGFIGRLLPHTEDTITLKNVCVIFILVGTGIIIFKQTASGKFLLKVGLILTANLLCNTIAWQHHLVWAIVPLLITFATVRDLRLGVRWYSALGIVYLLLAMNLRNPHQFPVLTQSHAFYGLCLLLFLQIALLRKPFPITRKSYAPRKKNK